MLSIDIICVGKLKEKFYISAAEEYLKRLGAFCNIKITELAEAKRSKEPSTAEIAACLLKESEQIKAAILKGAVVVAMCIEGKQTDSVEFSKLIEAYALSGASRIAFIIGGSDGLHDSIKKEAAYKMSMSKMTFPHHLARIMLLEQLYRGFCIKQGNRYHK